MWRASLRSLTRTPAFTTAALLCVALGVGATTTVFSIVSAALLRPLPFPDSDRLVRVYTEFPKFSGGALHRFWLSDPEVLQLSQVHSFSAVGAWQTDGVNLAAGDKPVHLTAAFVSADLMRALAIPPRLGRAISLSDDQPGAPKVALLSDALWRSKFAGDGRIVGREIYLNSERCTVIGIMPPHFAFPPDETDPPAVWTPLQLNRQSTAYADHNNNVLARLQPDASVPATRAEIQGLLRGWGLSDSAQHHSLHPITHPLSLYPLQEDLVGASRRSLLVLFGAVVFVLLIACVNVANLLLARSEGRQRELAIRRALGASSPQLLRQFLCEGMALSLAGAVLGLMLAVLSLAALRSLNPGSIPMADLVTIDWRVLVFTSLLSLGCGMAFGLAPLVQISATRIAEVLKQNSGRSSGTLASHRIRYALVSSQVALSFVLIIGAGLMVRGWVHLQSVNPGFDTGNLLTARISLPAVHYARLSQQQQFLTRLQTTLQQLPGVMSASVASALPPVRPVNDDDTDIEGYVRSPNGPAANVNFYQFVGDRFFETLRASIVQGRALEPRDGDARSYGVVINQTMAKTFWPGAATVVGHRIRPGFGMNSPWFTIVGVVADIRNAGLDKPVGTEAFFPNRWSPLPLSTHYLILRTRGNPEAITAAVWQALLSLDAALPISEVRSMNEVVTGATARPRFLTLILALFSGLALALAAVGLYGVVSYSVAQRTSEFGIKIALGASSRRLLWSVLQEGLWLSAAGAFCGVLGALFLTRSLIGMVAGVGSADLPSAAFAALVLLLTTLAASYFPALRATRIQPVSALRYD